MPNGMGFLISIQSVFYTFTNDSRSGLDYILRTTERRYLLGTESLPQRIDVLALTGT